MNQFAQAVLPLFEVNRADWLAAARETARAYAIKHGRVTIDDVRKLCPPPEGMDPRVMGAVLGGGGMFKKIGYEASARTECHGRPIGIFALNEVTP